MHLFDRLFLLKRAGSDNPRNYWPLLVPPACIGLWWCILAVAFNAAVADAFAIIASCFCAIIIALALLADALGIEDKFLHGEEPEDFERTSGSEKFS